MVANLLVLNIDDIKKKAKNNISTIQRAKRILKILERDKFRCIICGADKNLTIDFVSGKKDTKYRGPKHYKLEKCQTLCNKCHMKKNGWIK